MKSRLKNRIQILYMRNVESQLESFMHTVQIIITKSAEFHQYDASTCTLCTCIHLLQWTSFIRTSRIKDQQQDKQSEKLLWGFLSHFSIRVAKTPPPDPHPVVNPQTVAPNDMSNVYDSTKICVVCVHRLSWHFTQHLVSTR